MQYGIGDSSFYVCSTLVKAEEHVFEGLSFATSRCYPDAMSFVGVQEIRISEVSGICRARGPGFVVCVCGFGWVLGFGGTDLP